MKQKFEVNDKMVVDVQKYLNSLPETIIWDYQRTFVGNGKAEFQLMNQNGDGIEWSAYEKIIDDLKRKNIIVKPLTKKIERTNVNLKENYERLFGKMDTFNKLGQKTTSKPEQTVKLTTEQQNLWSRLNSAFSYQYPKRSLGIKNKNVVVDGHIVESVDKFFRLKLNEMATKVKTVVQSIKD